MSKRSGIYQIRNLETGMSYVGQSVNTAVRITQHRGDLGRGMHGNVHLQRSWNKHGAEAFAFELLAVIEPSLLTLFEQRAFDMFNAKYGCYNQGPFTDNALRGTMFSTESRHRMSKAHLNPSAETRRKMSEAQIGRKHSTESRLKIAKSMIGNKHGLGRRVSAEERRRTGDVHRGKIVSAETRRKLSEANRGNSSFRGKAHSIESRRKMSEAKTGNKNCAGRILSAETRRKLSEARKRWWGSQRGTKTAQGT